MEKTKVKNKSGCKVGTKELGKIIKIEELRSTKNINVKVGTVDMYNPSSVYVEITTWSNLKPVKYPEDLELWKKRFFKNIRQYTFNTIDSGPDIFDAEKTIVTGNIPSHQMVPGKSTYMSIEINLFQKGMMSLDDKDLIHSIERIISGINIFFTLNDIIEFSKKK